MTGEHESRFAAEQAATSQPAGPIASADVAVDATVYDVHPALLPSRLPPGDAHYPYGPRIPYDFEVAAPPSNPLADFVGWISKTTSGYIEVLNRPPDFVVPKTFGMSAILGIMTALALLFGCLRWADAWPVFYFFFGVQSLAICLVQMFYGQTPRLASIIAGAIILPLFTLAAAALTDRPNPAIFCVLVGFVPFGALLGYLTGTCAAGVFLVMGYLEPYLQGQRPVLTSPSSLPAPPS